MGINDKYHVTDEQKKELLNAERKAGLYQELEKKQTEGQVLYVTAIYDKRAETFQNVFTSPSKAFAVRGFMDACRDEKSPFYNYPQDFKLVCLGCLNTKTGEIGQKEVLETLMEAESVVIHK